MKQQQQQQQQQLATTTSYYGMNKQKQKHHHRKQLLLLPKPTILILGFCIICLYGILSFCKLSLSIIDEKNININNNLLQLQHQQHQQHQQQQRRRRSQTHEDIGGEDTTIIIKKNSDYDKGKDKNNLIKEVVVVNTNNTNNNHYDDQKQQQQQQQNEQQKEEETHHHHHHHDKKEDTDDVIIATETETAAKAGSSSSLTSSSSSICENHHVVYDQIRVANVTNTTNTTKRIKILCFIMTHSNSHKTKVRAVIDTWGKRCDTLLIASNTTDHKINAIKMNLTDSSYLGLWSKLNETMQYVWDHYYVNTTNTTYTNITNITNTNNQLYYDWILKADDDSYVIMENLKFFLLSDPVQTKINKNQSAELIFGRRYSSPRYRNLANQGEYFASPINAEFGKRFYNKINKHKPVLYNYGGSGYVMNWNYIQTFVNVMKGQDTIFGTPPEDQANGVVMAYQNIWPQPTRDKIHGREQFHPENPDFMYSMDKKYQKRWNDNHKSTGGISVGPDCCSENSIVFHHINPNKMRDMEQIFYNCRRGEIK